jgi:hypothetical protein
MDHWVQKGSDLDDSDRSGKCTTRRATNTPEQVNTAELDLQRNPENNRMVEHAKERENKPDSRDRNRTCTESKPISKLHQQAYVETDNISESQLLEAFRKVPASVQQILLALIDSFVAKPEGRAR